MSNGFFNVPIAVNEPVKGYAPGSAERKELLAEYKRMYNTTVDVPMYIGDKQIFTNENRNLTFYPGTPGSCISAAKWHFANCPSDPGISIIGGS